MFDFHSVIKRIEDRTYPWCLAFGFDPYTTKRAIKGILPTIKEYRLFKSNMPLGYNEFPVSLSMPRFAERFELAGIAAGHYFHQDLLVAQKIYHRNPVRHVDIGSRVDGFVAHVATFRQIMVFDIRPMESKTPNIIFHQSDLLQPQGEFNLYCDSLSCLHALEHFGLGRYGDPIRFDGHLRAFENLYAILKPGGILYLSVPIGPQRIEFNAHRVFAIQTILAMSENRFQLSNFSFVNDAGDLHQDIQLTPDLISNQCNCYYGLWIFEFEKINRTNNFQSKL